MFLSTRRNNPVSELSRMQQEMNRLMEGFFGHEPSFWPAVAARTAAASWPKIDVSETEGAMHVSAELPGLKQEDIDVEVHADTLKISGEKKDERVVDEHNFHSVERSFGRFERVIPLPVEIDSKKAEATFKEGVLSINLPKVTPVASQKIAVKSTT